MAKVKEKKQREYKMISVEPDWVNASFPVDIAFSAGKKTYLWQFAYDGSVDDVVDSVLSELAENFGAAATDEFRSQLKELLEAMDVPF
jgi:hypothetical protein